MPTTDVDGEFGVPRPVGETARLNDRVTHLQTENAHLRRENATLMQEVNRLRREAGQAVPNED